MAYKFGILTSLYDDDAPQLLATIDKAISDGIIEGEVPIVFCDKKEGARPEIDARIERVRQLEHLKEIIFLPPSSVKQGNLDRRLQYDTAAAEVLAASGSSSFLNIGYMRIMTPLLYEKFDIVNLHPGLPEIGPTGMWPDVMKEQAERPLRTLAQLELTDSEISRIMRIRYNKAGGMLHLVSGEVDRGPVISWYEFSLDTPRLRELWLKTVGDARHYEIESAKTMPSFSELADEIRCEQVQGEHPLLVLSYSKLSKGEWSIRDRTLYAGGEARPEGVDVTAHVGEYLRSRGIETAIR